MILGKKLLLASASPRRRELLSALDADTKIIKIRDVDESYPKDIEHKTVPEYIACNKRNAYDLTSLKENEILVTADTIVLLDDKILGKPATEIDAREMLKSLSGRAHEVITGVTLSTREKTLSFSTITKVYFSDLTDSEIDYYVSKYSPLDKAGAYGIQEWLGYIGINKIEGCYYNVMGLPVHDLYRHLLELTT